MTTPTLPIIDGCLYIDNSQLEHFQTCSRQWEYSNLFKRISASDAPALRFGRAAHKCMEYRHNLPLFDAILDGPQMLQAGVDYLMANPCPSEDWRNIDQLTGLIAAYNKQFPDDNFSIAKLDGTYFVEQPFGIPLASFKYHPPGAEPQTVVVIYSGRIDLAIRKDGALWAADHKTTSIMGDQYMDGLSMSSQFLGYMWALSHKLKERPAGYMVNVLGSRKPTEKGTGKRFEIARDYFFKDWSLVEEWFSNTVALLQEVFFHANQGYYPMKKLWCVGKFGKCQYFDVCSLPASARQTLLQSGMYKDNTWSPFNED